MRSIDLMVADEACQYTGMSHTELTSAAHTRGFKPIRLRALPDVTWYLFADIDVLRGRGAAGKTSVANEPPRPATAKPAGKKAAPKSKATAQAPAPTPAPEPAAPSATAEPAMFELPANAEPYPIDPDTEVEELSQLSKTQLGVLCGQLGIPDAANQFRRAQIARSIVDHKVNAWNARKAAEAEAASTVTPIRTGKRASGGRRETGTGKLLEAVGGGVPEFSHGGN